MKNGITIALLILNAIWLLIASWQFLDLSPLIPTDSANQFAVFINTNWFISFCIFFMFFYIGFFIHSILNKALTTKQRIAWAVFILLFNGLAFNIYWFYHGLKQHESIA
jgi:hypothetical protein